MTLHGLQRNIEKFDLIQTVSECMQETKETIIDLNLNQLLRGRDSRGEFLSPKYSEDPFFKSPESAKRYAQWKQSIDIATDKPFDVPNLRINGRFHRNMRVNVTPVEILIFNDDPDASKIEGKFGRDKVEGLNPESKAEYLEEKVMPLLKIKIEQKTGMRLT